jgi:hypothetical protein
VASESADAMTILEHPRGFIKANPPERRFQSVPEIIEDAIRRSLARHKGRLFQGHLQMNPTSVRSTLSANPIVRAQWRLIRYFAIVVDGDFLTSLNITHCNEPNFQFRRKAFECGVRVVRMIAQR